MAATGPRRGAAAPFSAPCCLASPGCRRRNVRIVKCEQEASAGPPGAGEPKHSRAALEPYAILSPATHRRARPRESADESPARTMYFLGRRGNPRALVRQAATGTTAVAFRAARLRGAVSASSQGAASNRGYADRAVSRLTGVASELVICMWRPPPVAPAGSVQAWRAAGYRARAAAQRRASPPMRRSRPFNP
jgi:hypothetical protein